MLFCAIDVVLETIKQHLRFLILKQCTEAIFVKINAKPLQHPEPCSVLGVGNSPRTWVRGGGDFGWGMVPISDFKRFAGITNTCHVSCVMCLAGR